MQLGSKRFLALALFTTLLIILVNFAWWSYYQRTEKLLEHQLSRRLQSIAQSFAKTMPTSLVDSLPFASVDQYRQVLRLLHDIRIADSLAEIFILDDRYEYIATSSPEPDSIYFLAGMNGSYIDSLFFSMTPHAIVTPAYQTGSLYLKSAFAPLLGEDSSVVAVVGVEANVDYFDDLSLLRRNLLYATGVSTIGGLILGILFLALQQRLNKAEQQLFLGQTHAYLGRMVAVVSHELKNPLMIIRGSAERIRKKTGAEEASFILEETDRLNNIVSGYLAFAKADGSLLVGESTESFDLTELLTSAAKHLGERFVDQQIDWREQPTPEPVLITGFRRSLRQVILNLLVNGVEGCLEAGKPVILGTEIEQKSRDRVAIRITNYGPELSPKEIQRLFTPFHTTKQTGSGLGLYVSRKLVEEMGGKLNLVSKTGSGAVSAIIELPAHSS